MIEARYRGTLPESPPWVQSYLESQEWWPDLDTLVTTTLQGIDDKFNIVLLLTVVDRFFDEHDIGWMEVDFKNQVVDVNIEITPEITMFILKNSNSA